MKKFLLFFAIVLCSAPVLRAQYSIRYPDAVPLHGVWSFALDPLDAGEKQEWYLSSKTFYRTYETWDKVEVPHCFSADPRYRYFNGTAWYRRSFHWQASQDKRTILHFDAVYYECSVWLNDKKVGTHEGGYTPFSFDISDHLKAGENQIVIRVTNDTWKPGTIPGAKDKGPNTFVPGWVNYGGITRPVYLTVEPATYIENTKVEATPDLAKRTAQLRAKVFIKKSAGSAATVTPSLSVLLDKRKVAVSWKFSNPQNQADGVVEVEAFASLKPADVKLWSLDEPVCYQLQAIVPGDTITTTFGIRKVEVKNTQLLLNGVPVKMAGANRVMDYPGLGSLEPDWLVEKDFTLMKRAGMEFQRLTHYTTTEAVLDWADRNGMMIVAEAGNWQLTPEQMDTDSIRAKFRQQFDELVKRDWNHPSVIAYSVGNEYLSDTPSGQRWTKDMIAHAKEVDPTRLYTFATMRQSPLPKNPEDEASQYVDFVCANIYGNQAAILDNIHRLYPDKPILVSEYGIRVDNKNGEQGQVDYLKNYLNDIRSRPYVVGASWWSFNDYESRHWGTNKNGYRPWGVVGPDRTPRQMYALHQVEMSPLVVTKKSFTVGKQGNHELVLEVKSRADFPAYPTRNYKLRTTQREVAIPDLSPGQTTEVKIPVTGFNPSVKVEIIKPTGFSIVEINVDLNYD
ncbi:beta galactosidase jelly roll domain-containing protein [Fulvivirgaceae bacterium PWU4]|uniref:Beta galactosidase jelly roll domain-containing protein n=1 Tax=Chryseosolibacter histidini TaxID=2782349 RepID=A0AAP2GN00_9BACT|nr:glycoside hydrolase family 2 TIM barrel-domain containing protein [Chryseosolibacter histidini]MBT1696370.1 beta galactosidase jelly roll domain-containing protein [Chryseosolibacter histidini]